MTKLMARYGIENIRAALEGSVAGTKESQYYTNKLGKRRRRHAPAVQKYIRAVHKNPRRHMRLDERRGGGYEPVGATRKIAERYGTRGYIDQEAGASMPIFSTEARPEDLRPTPPKPKAVATGSPQMSMPRPAPTRSLPEEPARRKSTLATRSTPARAPVSKSLFQSEYFIEE